MLLRWISLAICLVSTNAFAWGDEGHEIVALIADHYVQPQVHTKIAALLKTDTTHLAPTDIAHEATWADKFRDSDRNTTKVHYNQTHDWHFVDIELADGNLDTACFGHPALPAGTAASVGPPRDCVVDKIDEFEAELHNPQTPPVERRLALQFLLHFVGDIHQPLHASDDHDKGGNAKIVSAAGFTAGNLHHFWDTEFVQHLGSDPAKVAQSLIQNITPAQRQSWSAGTPSDWAKDSFTVAKAHAYGMLPAPSPTGSYRLTPAYVTDASATVSSQLSKAGVRLAMLLDAAFQ